MCVAVWIAAFPCARAAADGVESVQLRIADCGEVSGQQIEKLVELELRSRENLSLELDGSGAGLRASLACSGDAAVITVEDPTRGAPLVLEMQLAQTRLEARPRLLALAIAELIATSRLEHVPVAAAANEDEKNDGAERSREEEPSDEADRARVSVWLAGGLASEFQPRHWAGIFAAGASFSVARFSVDAELGFEGATETSSQANVRARAASLALAPSFALVRDACEWRIGIGARASYAWLQAVAREAALRAGTVSGVVIEPFVTTTLVAPIASTWFVRVALDLGYVAKPLRGVDADDRSVLEVKGIRAAVLLGLGLHL